MKEREEEQRQEGGQEVYVRFGQGGDSEGEGSGGTSRQSLQSLASVSDGSDGSNNSREQVLDLKQFLELLEMKNVMPHIVSRQEAQGKCRTQYDIEFVTGLACLSPATRRPWQLKYNMCPSPIQLKPRK